jgi:hypothetical protein
MPYQLTTGTSGITSFPALLALEITAPILVVKVRNLTFPRRSEWIRAGYIQAISQTDIGAVAGRPERVVFDKQIEIALEIPAYPYRVQFSPKDYVTRWELEIYSKDKAGPDGQAIANAPTLEQTDLLNSLGLTGLESSLKPESFALVTAILKATTEKGRYARTIAYTPSLIPVQIFVQRNDRSGATLFNASDKSIYIGFDGSLTPSSAVEMLLPGGQWVLDGAYIGPIWMVASGDGVASVTVVEYANTPFS